MNFHPDTNPDEEHHLKVLENISRKIDTIKNKMRDEPYMWSLRRKPSWDTATYWHTLKTKQKNRFRLSNERNSPHQTG